MGVDNSVPLPQRITALIQNTARRKVGLCRLTESDQEELEQQIAMEVIRRRPKFDSATEVPEEAFLAQLVKNAAADIMAARHAASRDYRREEGSLDRWVEDESGQMVRPADAVTEDAADLRFGRGGLSAEDLRDLKIDMMNAAAALPGHLREIFEHFVKAHGSVPLAAERAGVHRSTAYDLIAQIRQHFKAAGMEIYMGSPTNLDDRW